MTIDELITLKAETEKAIAEHIDMHLQEFKKQSGLSIWAVRTDISAIDVQTIGDSGPRWQYGKSEVNVEVAIEKG